MCPECHSPNVSRSKHWKIRDSFMRLIRMRAYRCLDCRYRFYLAIRLEEQARHGRRWLRSVHDQAGARQHPSA